MTDYRDLIEKCEGYLRTGDGLLAAQALGGLRVTEIPRQYRLPLANICRRANLLSVGLKILANVIASHRERTEEATSSELAEYAVLLERCGAVKEALSILKHVDTSKAPEAYLYRAFCHFKSWDYGAAIPELIAHIDITPSPYLRLVGQVNLAAAYVIDEKYDLAKALIDKNIALANEHGFTRLKGNCHELRGQLLLRQNDFSGARASLNEAEHIFSQEKTFDQFFVRKWQTVLKSFDTKDHALLVGLKQEAFERKDWETVREADLFQLSLKFNESQFNHLYFGTPFESYRNRIRSFLGKTPQSKHFLHGELGGPVFNLATGEISDGDHLNPGKLIHRTIGVLLRDLYRPLRIGGLFAEIYPDEYFDIYSSPGRIHQLLFRMRDWIKENQIPVALVEDQRTYSLAVNGTFAFQLAAEEQSVEGWIPTWTRLITEFQSEQEITARDVRSRLQLKPSSCKRFLKWAVETGRLDRHGENNFSCYTLAANEMKSAA